MRDQDPVESIREIQKNKTLSTNKSVNHINLKSDIHTTTQKAHLKRSLSKEKVETTKMTMALFNQRNSLINTASRTAKPAREFDSMMKKIANIEGKLSKIQDKHPERTKPNVHSYSQSRIISTNQSKEKLTYKKKYLGRHT